MRYRTIFEEFIAVGYELAQEVLRPYSGRFSPKKYRQSQLLVLLILKRYKEWRYRETQEMVLANPPIQELLGLKRVVDYSTLQKFFVRLGRRRRGQGWER